MRGISCLEVADGYLVWNTKCHMMSKNPLDQSIVQYVKREKFENCSSSPPLTNISRVSNGSIYLVINHEAAKQYSDLSCCWTPVIRPSVAIELLSVDKEYDSKIR